MSELAQKPEDPEEHVLGIERPDFALMEVYLVRALLGAVAFLFVPVAIGGRILGSEGAKAILEFLTKNNLVPFAAVGAYASAYALAALAFYIRYRTLRYHFDDDGVQQKWGLFFQRESFLAYARIQDVQVSQGVAERLFGVGTVKIQTASGAKGAEEAIEGLREFELVRDFLKARMQGQRLGKPGQPARAAAKGPDPIAVIAEIRDEVRSLRATIEQRS